MKNDISFEDFGMTQEEFKNEALEGLRELQAQGKFLDLDFNYIKEHFWENPLVQEENDNKKGDIL